MRPVAIEKSSRFLWVMTFTSAAMAFAGLGLALSGTSPTIGWLNFLFFGACTISIGYQAGQTGPRVVIDDSGIFDRTLGIGTIPWSDIDDAFVKIFSSSKFVCLELHDPRIYAAKLSSIKRRLVDANRKLGYTDFSVNLTGTKADPHEVCELILKQIELRREGAA